MFVHFSIGRKAGFHQHIFTNVNNSKRMKTAYNKSVAQGAVRHS